MSLDITSDLRCLVMLDGTVFGNVEKAATRRPIELRLGDALSPFETCDHAPDTILSQPRRVALNTRGIAETSHSLPVEEIPGDVYACWVNHLEDWTLAGAQTIQIMVNRYHTPCQIFLERKIHLPKVEPGMTFHARLAAHRAAATLCLTFRDPVSRQETRQYVPFDTSYPGGTQARGYADISCPLPGQFDACDISLEIEYRKHLPDDKGIEPFLFLADVHVARASADPLQPLLLEPEWLHGEAAVADGDWFRASLPNAIAPGQDVALQLGRDVFPITPMSKSDFEVTENYGHTLVCRSSQDLELVLVIDGKHVKTCQISTGDTVIKVQPEHLNGRTRMLSLRDKSGSVTLFQQLQLMPSILTPEDVMRRESAAPFPNALLPQTPHRYAGLKAVVAAAELETDFEQIVHALETLEGGPENVRFAQLTFPEVADPDVSVIIPAHNNLNYTYLTLCSLLIGQNRASFEVILVDDASTDETATIEELVSGITVVRHPCAQRFIRACNAGAERARGRQIALLNNDVEVTTGWLDELLAGFDRFPNAGLVGSRLLYPDGTLQDAGGIVWNSGNPWNYGNGQNAEDPRFNYARQADYLSGAALMVPTDIWRSVGGLSAYLEPMYFEDTDLAFKVRQAGHETWYIPSSTVYHFEGKTSGTDTSTGFKKFQEVNRPKFKRQWAAAFAGRGAEGNAPDLEKDRGIIGRVLFIDHAPPRADKDAGSYAAVQEMRLVQSLGYKVTFVSTNMAHLGRYTEELQKQGVEVIHAPFWMNVSEYLDRHATDFDAVFITRYYVAQGLIDQIRRQAPKARILFNNADLHFLRELRAARTEDSAELLDRARKTRTEEMDVIRKVDVVLSYNEVEHSVIQAYADGQSTVVKCPWVVQVPDARVGLAARSGISFLGSYRHHPNVEGIQWFARTIMPRVVANDPAAHLTIYGAGMTKDVIALNSPNVSTSGFVQDIATAFDAHRVFVAPLLSGAGIKGKVMAALSHGIPCVLSPVAAEGVGLRSGHDCFIVETNEDWVRAIQVLSTNDHLWQQMSDNARSYMEEAYSFDRGRELMRKAFEAADLYGARP